MESTLAITRLDLLRSVGRLLGLGRDSTAWPANMKIDVNDVVDVGSRTFYHPPILPGETNSHNWSFMEPVLARFEINAPYSEGTVTVVSGVVTLSGGTFPTWAADGEIEVGGVSYTVATRDSGTQVTLDNTTVTAAAGTSYALRQVDVSLPDLFGAVSGDVYFRDTNDVFRYGVQRVSMDQILELRQQETFTTEPIYYAIQPVEQTGESGQRWMMSIWPPSDEAVVMTFKYTINPYQLTATLPYPMGGMPFGECLRESCLAAAEREIKGEVGLHSQWFMELLKAAVSFDRRASNPSNLGYNGQGRYPFGNDRRLWIGEREWIRRADTSVMGFS